MDPVTSTLGLQPRQVSAPLTPAVRDLSQFFLLTFHTAIEKARPLPPTVPFGNWVILPPKWAFISCADKRVWGRTSCPSILFLLGVEGELSEVSRAVVLNLPNAATF